MLLAHAFFVPTCPHRDKPMPRTPAAIRDTLEVNGQPLPDELGLIYPALRTARLSALPPSWRRGGVGLAVRPATLPTDEARPK